MLAPTLNQVDPARGGVLRKRKTSSQRANDWLLQLRGMLLCTPHDIDQVLQFATLALGKIPTPLFESLFRQIRKTVKIPWGTDLFHCLVVCIIDMVKLHQSVGPSCKRAQEVIQAQTCTIQHGFEKHFLQTFFFGHPPITL